VPSCPIRLEDDDDSNIDLLAPPVFREPVADVSAASSAFSGGVAGIEKENGTGGSSSNNLNVSAGSGGTAPAISSISAAGAENRGLTRAVDLGNLYTGYNQVLLHG
jgi:hypothetical protein